MVPLPPRLLTVRELGGLGLCPDSAQRAVRRGELVRVVPGVFAPRAWWHPLQPHERAYMVHVAISLRARRPPIFCRHSAATVLGLRVLHTPRVPHVIQQSDQGSRNNRSVVHHWAELPATDVVEVDGFRATSAARTAVDCARFLPTDAALTVVDHTLQLGVARDDLLARCTALPGHRGVRRARAVIEAADPRSESVGETLTRLVIIRADLPRPELQWEIRLGRSRFRPDFAWPEARLILEFDGLLKYDGQHGATPQVVLAERQREKQLTNAGWRVLRTDWKTVTGCPEALVALLRRELAGRGRRNRG